MHSDKEQHSSQKRSDLYVVSMLYLTICHCLCPETVDAFFELFHEKQLNAVNMWHLHHWNDLVKLPPWHILGKNNTITIHRFVTCSCQQHCGFKEQLTCMTSWSPCTECQYKKLTKATNASRLILASLTHSYNCFVQGQQVHFNP